MKTKSEYLEITAAKDGGGKHKVAGVAYGGGKMRLFGWSRPVVVDLSGMTVPESVPLLANHENHTWRQSQRSTSAAVAKAHSRIHVSSTRSRTSASMNDWSTLIAL